MAVTAGRSARVAGRTTGAALTISGPLRGSGQIADARHFSRPEPFGIGHVVGDHAGRIEAPEQLAVDRERRHAEHAERLRALAVRAQFVFDRLRRDYAIGVGNTQLRGQCVPPGGIVERPALAPDEMEYAGD